MEQKEAWREKEYICAACGNTYNYGWSEEEQEAEKYALFGDVPDEECAVVCDDCFKAMRNPMGAYYAQWGVLSNED